MLIGRLGHYRATLDLSMLMEREVRQRPRARPVPAVGRDARHVCHWCARPAVKPLPSLTLKHGRSGSKGCARCGGRALVPFVQISSDHVPEPTYTRQRKSRIAAVRSNPQPGYQRLRPLALIDWRKLIERSREAV
jgi:hypothetical protein